jgi:hypothetical protein
MALDMINLSKKQKMYTEIIHIEKLGREERLGMRWSLLELKKLFLCEELVGENVWNRWIFQNCEGC